MKSFVQKHIEFLLGGDKIMRTRAWFQGDHSHMGRNNHIKAKSKCGKGYESRCMTPYNFTFLSFPSDSNDVPP